MIWLYFLLRVSLAGLHGIVKWRMHAAEAKHIKLMGICRTESLAINAIGPILGGDITQRTIEIASGGVRLAAMAVRAKKAETKHDRWAIATEALSWLRARGAKLAMCPFVAYCAGIVTTAEGVAAWSYSGEAWAYTCETAQRISTFWGA